MWNVKSRYSLSLNLWETLDCYLDKRRESDYDYVDTMFLALKISSRIHWREISASLVFDDIPYCKFLRTSRNSRCYPTSRISVDILLKYAALRNECKSIRPHFSGTKCFTVCQRLAILQTTSPSLSSLSLSFTHNKTTIYNGGHASSTSF